MKKIDAFLAQEVRAFDFGDWQLDAPEWLGVLKYKDGSFVEPDRETRLRYAKEVGGGNWSFPSRGLALEFAHRRGFNVIEDRTDPRSRVIDRVISHGGP